MLSAFYVNDEPILLDIRKRFLEKEGTIRVVVLEFLSEALKKIRIKK